MKPQELILVIDVGSTNSKAVLCDLKGGIRGRGSAPSGGGGPDRASGWWAAVRQAVAGVHELNAGASRHITAIIVTGHMHSLTALDGNGEVIPVPAELRDPTLVRNERLAGNEQDIYRRTGARLFAGAPAVWLCRAGREYPELLRKAAVFLPCKDYIRFRLTGEPCTDPIDAAGTLLYNLLEKKWDAEIAGLVGINLRQLPPLRSSLEPAGFLRPEPARELGLKSGLPVITGAGDDIETLGGGLVRPGLCLEHLGTTGSMLICTDTPVFDPRMRLELYPHALDGLWVVGGSTNHAGSALSWARECFSTPACGRDAGLRTGARAGAIPGPLFLPYLSGERCPLWNHDVRGCFFGLDFSHTKQDLLQSVFEGVAFSLRHILETAGELGFSPDGIIAVDPSAAARPWLQLRANIYNRKLYVPLESDGAVLGSLLLAAAAVGAYSDLETAVKALIGDRKCIVPEAAAAAAYEELFSRYRRLSASSMQIG